LTRVWAQTEAGSPAEETAVAALAKAFADATPDEQRALIDSDLVEGFQLADDPPGFGITVVRPS
jgi:hypothetical protein